MLKKLPADAWRHSFARSSAAHPWHIVLIQSPDLHVEGGVGQVGDVDGCCAFDCVVVPDQDTAVAVSRIKAAQDIQRPTGALCILQGT